MRSVYDAALEVMTDAHERLVASIPPPQVVDCGGHNAFRCVEKTPLQAVVLKAGAAISSLRASLHLLDHGHLMEQGALHRMIDELNEDVLFVALAVINNAWTPQHDQFMEAFFAEEFASAVDIVATRRRRNLVPRRKIRAYIANNNGMDNPHRDTEVSETLSGMYSGFVHGAAQHILVCYGGYPPRFHLDGLQGTPLVEQHMNDAWNYVYRTLHSVGFAAAAIGDKVVCDHVRSQLEAFERATGRAPRGIA